MKIQAVPIMRGRSIRIRSGIRGGQGMEELRCKEGLWMVIEKRINIEHSQTAERHKEAVLAVGLAFFTEVYEFCVRRLLMEEDKEERTALKKHRVKKIKGIKVVLKVQGRPDRAIMPRPAVFNMKTKYDRGREKRQIWKEIDEQY